MHKLQGRYLAATKLHTNSVHILTSYRHANKATEIRKNDVKMLKKHCTPFYLDPIKFKELVHFFSQNLHLAYFLCILGIEKAVIGFGLCGVEINFEG